MIENLQALRAFAAINVVFFHIIGTAQSYGYTTGWLSALEGWGANGVDVFFVISGFVMLHTQLRRKRNLASFYTSRLIRIVPTYWFLTMVTVLSFLLLPETAFRNTMPSGEHILSSLLFLSGVWLEKYPVIYLGWTLEWEMLFYLVFGASLLFDSWSKSIWFVLIVLVLIAFGWSRFIVLEFFAGMLVAYIFHHRPLKAGTGNLVLLLGTILLLASLIGQIKQLQLNRLLVWGLPSFFIVLGAVSSKQLRSSILRYLGDASYSIYLVQMLSIPVFYKLMVWAGVEINNDLLALLCLAATVVVGAALYAGFEKPVTNVLRSKHLIRSGSENHHPVREP